MIPGDIFKAFMEAGNDWADKHGAAELLETNLKTLKAHITLQAKDLEQCSMAQAETIALASDGYRDMAQEAVRARTAANRAKVRYDSTKALFDAQRTVEASERAAMRSAT